MTENEQQMNADTRLLDEARDLIERSRTELSNTDVVLDQTKQQTRNTQRKDMTTTVTPQQAAELYSAGKTISEVAIATGVTYAKARKLVIDSGTPIRDASSRLKGRTRSKKASA